jgi:hypothetical protein
MEITNGSKIEHRGICEGCDKQKSCSRYLIWYDGVHGYGEEALEHLPRTVEDCEIYEGVMNIHPVWDHLN